MKQTTYLNELRPIRSNFILKENPFKYITSCVFIFIETTELISSKNFYIFQLNAKQVVFFNSMQTNTVIILCRNYQ